MNFILKKKLKIASLVTATVAVVVGVTVGVSTAAIQRENMYDFIISESYEANSINYNRDYVNARFVTSNSVEGLFNPYYTPDRSPVQQVVGTKPFTWKYFSSSPSAPLSNLNEGVVSTIPGSTDIAEGLAMSGEIYSFAPKTVSYRMQIRTNSYWENGDLVTADDFVDSMKYIVMPSSAANQGSALAPLNEFDKLKNKKDLLKQIKSIKDLDSDVGISGLKEFFMQPKKDGNGKYISGDGRGSVFSEYVKDSSGKILEQYVTFTLVVDSATQKSASGKLRNFSYSAAFYPVNRKFIESIGYEKFGTSKETFLSNGPFTLKAADFDFEFVYEKNNLYWDSERVLSNRWARRLIRNSLTAQALFKTGKIGVIQVAPEQYSVYAQDPYFKQFLIKGSSSEATYGFYYNLEAGPNKLYTRNVHFRRALLYSINREKILATLGYTGTPTSDIFSANIPRSTDENNTTFRDYFLNDSKKPEVASDLFKSFAINGFKQNMIYFTYEELTYGQVSSSISKEKFSKDPQFNVEFARNEFKEFEKDMIAQNIPLKQTYNIESYVSTDSQEQSAIYIKQAIKEVFGTRINYNVIRLSDIIVSQYSYKFSDKMDIYWQGWGQDTDHPFTFTRLWALLTNPTDTGFKPDVGFTGYMSYTNPKKELTNDEFSIMDDIEKTLGNPKTKETFETAMWNIFRVDWVKYESWFKLKTYLTNWQKHIGGATQTEDDAISNQVLELQLEVEYDGVKANSIKETYEWCAIMELMIKLYAPGIVYMHSALTAWATAITNSNSTNSFYNVSYKSSYICSTPPKTQWQLPGCEIINKRPLPISEEKTSNQILK